MNKKLSVLDLKTLLRKIPDDYEVFAEDPCVHCSKSSRIRIIFINPGQPSNIIKFSDILLKAKNGD